MRKHAKVPNQYDFDKKILRWLPSNTGVEVCIRSFKNALFSLLTNTQLIIQDNISLPHSHNPYSYENHPPVEVISELHHGNWWSRTWAKRCVESRKEILVPIILYTDGISLDANSRQNLMPLNFTLGIFNTLTRRRPEAWELLYFHPDQTFMASQQNKKTLATDNISNLHNGLELALESLKLEMEKENSITWKHLPWNNTTYEVNMKFAVAFIIGDTELHDKLCCRYGGRNADVKKICRHCNCPSSDLVDPAKQHSTTLWKPKDFSLLDDIGEPRPPNYWKEISHHPVANIFHKIDFGDNPYNIHFASPGECLHMHQLGAARRSVESFKIFVQSQQKDKRGKREEARIELALLAKSYGGYLTRQSDRNFPRTKFSSSYLQDTKKQGNEYAGIILSIIVSIISTFGKSLLKNKALALQRDIDDQIRTLELILFMEEFLKNSQIKKNELDRLPKMIDYYITQINENCKRDGMGTKLVKNHLYFHLPQYIEYWGPPTGWDSSFSESHHKTEVKAPSKNTQQNAHTLIEQTMRRVLEKKILERVSPNTFMEVDDTKRRVNAAGGAKFRIFLSHGVPTMRYEDKNNQMKSVHPTQVLQFCCDQFVNEKASFVVGFTEHNRECGDYVYKFRAHPSYHGDSGQRCYIWYDWAEFLYKTEENGDNEQGITHHAPAQIVCFLHLGPDNTSMDSEEPIEHGLYAVVRSFEAPAVPVPPSRIIFEGTLENSFYLYSCDAINGAVAVVPHVIGRGNEDEDNNNIYHHRNFFVVRNRDNWLSSFHEIMNEIA